MLREGDCDRYVTEPKERDGRARRSMIRRLASRFQLCLRGGM
jgi:hypothetical protein